MRRRRMWVVAGAMVALVAGVGLLALHGRGGARSLTAPSTAAAVHSSPALSSPALGSPAVAETALSAPEASALAGALTSGQRGIVSAVVVMPSGQSVPTSAVAGLAALAPIAVDPSSFREVASGVGQVTATTGNGSRWTWFLLWQGGRWRLVDTAPALASTGPVPESSPAVAQ